MSLVVINTKRDKIGKRNKSVKRYKHDKYGVGSCFGERLT